MYQDGIRNRVVPMEQSIEQQIVQRTWGRVHGLRVELKADRVVVHGCTPSYYVKQLALEGALDAVSGQDSKQVELDIKVGPRL